MEQDEVYKPLDNGFAKLASVLGITAIVSTFFVPLYMPLICGAIAIILALLSRGKGELPSKAWTGVITGSIAIIINVAIAFSSIYLFMNNPIVRMSVNETSRKLYGYTINELIEESVGDGFDLEEYLANR